MSMFSYVVKRILLMLLTIFVILTICFILIRMLPLEPPMEEGKKEVLFARWEALGYGKTIRQAGELTFDFNAIPMSQKYFTYIKNIFNGDWGTSWYISYLQPVTKVISTRLLPTVLVNIYSLLFAVPIGIALGIYAALKKNKWQDHVISTLVMVSVSVPSYVYAFLVQYVFYSKLGWFPAILSSLFDAGTAMGIEESVLLNMINTGNVTSIWFSGPMFKSMVLPIMSLSFGVIAGLARFTRAELTEVLTSEFMLLARTKGLTKGQATVRHALNNAMVPILPSIISMFVGILGGSLIIEQIFAIPGIGKLYITSINLRDYDVFMADTAFYTFIGLAAGIIVDLSYGFIDPRIRMGAKK